MNISQLNPEKLYDKNKLDVDLINNLSKLKGNLILFNGYNQFIDFKEFYGKNASFSTAEYYSRYFFPRRIMMNFFNTGSTKRIDLNQDERYDLIEQTFPGKLSTFKTLSQYSDYNTIIDLSYLNFHFQKLIRKYKNYMWIENMFKFLSTENETMVKFDSVFVMIPTDFKLMKFEKDFPNLFSVKDFKTIHPLTFYFNFLKSFSLDKNNNYKVYYPAASTAHAYKDMLKNVHYVFYSNNTNKFFYVHNEAVNMKKVENMLRVMIKQNHGMPLEQFELDLLAGPAILDKLQDKLMPDKIYQYSSETDEYKSNRMKNEREVTAYIKETAPKKVDDVLEMFGFNSLLVGATKEQIKELADTIPDDASPDNKNALEENDVLKGFIKDRILVKQAGFSDVEQKILNNAKDKRASVQYVIRDDKRTLTEIINSYKKKELKPDVIKEANVINKEMEVLKLTAINREYLEELYDEDIVKVFNAMENDIDNPLILTDLRKENTSSELNYVDTYYAEYKNKHNKKFNVKVDIPIIIDESFMFLNSVKKSIAKQMASLPIVKNKQDRLFVSSNYNKIELSIRGQKLNSKIEKFIKTMRVDKIPGLTFLERDSILVNKEYINNIEYNYYSTTFYNISIGDNNFVFNRKDLEATLLTKKYFDDKYDKAVYFPIGYNDRSEKVFFVNISGNDVCVKEKKEKYINRVYFDLTKVDEGFSKLSDICDITDYLIFLCSGRSKTFKELLYAMGVGKSYTHTYAVVLSRNVPLILLLASQLKLTEIMDRYKIQYEVSDKRKQLKNDDKLYWRYINFADFNIYYKADAKIEMLMNGLYEANTDEYTFEQVNNGSMVSDYLQRKFGNRGLIKGFRSILSKMMDPITVDVARDLKYPDNIYDMLLYGNTLLSNLEFLKKNDLKNYRIRTLEIIPAHLYKVLADEHNRYIFSAGNRYSLPQDAVVKSLLNDKLVENYSILNPTFEAQDGSKATWRGISGINLDEAYDIEMRSYDKSMMGFFGTYTPENSNVGTTRYLSLNPKITSLRGYIDHTVETKDLHAANMFSIAELNSPFSPMHSDPPRQGMVVKQTEHVIPTMENTAPLILSGGEKLIPHMIGTDFIYVAKQDGVVKKVDKNSRVIVLQLKDGTEDVIDVSEKISKNSSGGFFIANQLIHSLTVGKKFKKGEILAKNEDYFKTDVFGDPVFATGTLAKVALCSMDATVEDGSLISNKFAGKLASYVTMEEEIIIDTMTSVDYMAKIGEHIEIGDNICVLTKIFDVNNKVIDMLDRLEKDSKNTLTSYSQDGKKSHYSGEIIDIRIYYNRDISEFPTKTQQLIKSFINLNKDKHKLIMDLKHKSMPNVHIPRIEKIEGRKIGGREIDGCIIKIYIKHKDEARKGDKITFQTALKTVVSRVYDAEKEIIYAENNPNECLDAVVGGLSLVSRMTTDFKNLLGLQTLLVHLKEKLTELYK